MENEKAPADSTTGEKGDVRNAHVNDIFRDMLNGITPLVNCNPALAVELGFDPNGEPGRKFTLEEKL